VGGRFDAYVTSDILEEYSEIIDTYIEVQKEIVEHYTGEGE